MKVVAMFLLLLSSAFIPFNKSVHEKIIGKWHAVKLENPGMDSFYASTQEYIDTIGKNNDAATNLELYSATNVDSIRQILQLQLDSAKKNQQEAVVNTMFNLSG